MGKFCSCQKAQSLIPEKLPGMLVPVKYGAQSGHRSFIDLVPGLSEEDWVQSPFFVLCWLFFVSCRC